MRRIRTYTVGVQEIHYNYVTVEVEESPGASDAILKAEAQLLAMKKYEVADLDGYLEFSHTTGVIKGPELTDTRDE